MTDRISFSCSINKHELKKRLGLDINEKVHDYMETYVEQACGDVVWTLDELERNELEPQTTPDGRYIPTDMWIYEIVKRPPKFTNYAHYEIEFQNMQPDIYYGSKSYQYIGNLTAVRMVSRIGNVFPKHSANIWWWSPSIGWAPYKYRRYSAEGHENYREEILYVINDTLYTMLTNKWL